MVSTTSGLTQFTLDVDDIIEQAYEPLGGEYLSGPDISKARRLLNLILIQLQNKNIPLNKIATEDVAIVAGTFTYTLDASIVDVLELNVETDADGLEIPLERWGLREYHQVPNKTVTNRPTLWTTDRQEDAVIVKFWPIPDIAYTAKMLVSKRIEDITASYQQVDLSYRYYPLLVKWLSYELSLTKTGFPLEKIALLKLERDEVTPDTFDEDRERADFHIVLGGISGR